MGDDIHELIRLRKLRRNLELPAYLFERFGGRCKGDCEQPVTISPTQPEALTCCNLRPSWVQYNEVRGLERTLTAKIQTHKPIDGPVDAPLGDRYERTFTGTYVGRKLLEDGPGEGDAGACGETDQPKCAMG